MKDFIARFFNKKEKNETAQPVVSEKKSLLTAAEEAAVAMALYLCRNKKEDPRVITMAERQTEWNAKIYGLNNLHR